MNPCIGLTMGDPAGIGPEIIQTLLATEPGNFRLFGDANAFIPGRPSVEGAQAAFAALEESVVALKSGEIAAVVTGPIHKAWMYQVGFRWPGQTEFFAERFGVKNYAMLLTGGNLSVGLVTIHEPLAKVASLLTREEIVRTGSLLLDFLRLRLGNAPRLAVAGLNPHAGESGTIGTEEISVITPAVDDLKKAYPEATIGGPFPPDTVFYSAVLGEWDGVLCMYHDQGLIPLKLHAFHEGVNVTLGLPIIRTSPDHGTAFDLAGAGVARSDSFRAAIRLAKELVEKRAQ